MGGEEEKGKNEKWSVMMETNNVQRTFSLFYLVLHVKHAIFTVKNSIRVIYLNNKIYNVKEVVFPHSFVFILSPFRLYFHMVYIFKLTGHFLFFFFAFKISSSSKRRVCRIWMKRVVTVFMVTACLGNTGYIHHFCRWSFCQLTSRQGK